MNFVFFEIGVLEEFLLIVDCDGSNLLDWRVMGFREKSLSLIKKMQQKMFVRSISRFFYLFYFMKKCCCYFLTLL
jgi:hypothetical protein